MTLNAVASSFDESLNQIAALVAYYKTNRRLYEFGVYKTGIGWPIAPSTSTISPIKPVITKD